MSGAKRSARQPLVHFTHHPCVVHGLTGGRWTGGEMSGDGRKPDLHVCESGRRRSSRRINTVEVSAVTCRSCLSAMAKNTKEEWSKRASTSTLESNTRYWENWTSDRELVRRAWWDCCRKLGAPWPYEDAERIETERRFRAHLLLKRCSGSALMHFVGPVMEPTNIRGMLCERLAELDISARAVMATFLENAERADLLLAEVQRELIAINEGTKALAARIRSSWLVALPAVS